MTLLHFTGIKGSGMSSLAQLLHDSSYRVQGSDVEKYFFTEAPLHERNIEVLPFHEDNIQEGMTVIAGNAFKDDHPELQKAHDMGLEVIRYHDFLGDYMKQFTSIGVTGTHGKTSTTGLLSHVLSGHSATSFLIGDGTGKGVEQSEYFVFEACEYKRHFLAYHPDYAIMTNVDFDHPDYFTSLDDILDAFGEMAGQVKKALIACGDDENLQKMQSRVPIVYYGLDKSNDFYAANIEKDSGGSSFDVFIRNEFYYRFTIRQAGDHAIKNALGVIALCHYENIPADVVNVQFATFEGVKRRFSVTEYKGRILVDDYAHHPTEIRATLDSARQKYPDREVVAVFQPHTFTRTAALLDQFAESLQGADHVYLCDIFSSAREQSGSLTIANLIEKIPNSRHLKLADPSLLADHSDAVILFMGAGDIQQYLNRFKDLLAEGETA